MLSTTTVSLPKAIGLAFSRLNMIPYVEPHAEVPVIHTARFPLKTLYLVFSLNAQKPGILAILFISLMSSLNNVI